MEELVDITDVEVVGGYRLRLTFADGTVGWPGGLDMAPEPLYAEARRHPARPAPANRHRSRESSTRKSFMQLE